MAFCPANYPAPGHGWWSGWAQTSLWHQLLSGRRFRGQEMVLGAGKGLGEGWMDEGRGWERDGWMREGIAGLWPSPLPVLKPGCGSAGLFPRGWKTGWISQSGSKTP